MRIRLEHVPQLPVGKRLDRMHVLACVECEEKFLGRMGALYCSTRCGSRHRQRRKRLGPRAEE